MNQNQIKWLATGLMLIDHIGFMLEAEPMRIFGRFSFPLFAWLFAQTWQRPGDKKALIARLLLFGILSQIPYTLLFGDFQLNIMFSFATVAITFYCIRKFDCKIAILGISLASTQILQISYGWYAIVCTLLMVSLNGKGDRLWWWGWSIANIGYTISLGNSMQIFAILTPLIFVHNKNEQKNEKSSTLEKRFFYYFYPLHMVVLAALRAIT